MREVKLIANFPLLHSPFTCNLRFSLLCETKNGSHATKAWNSSKVNISNAFMRSDYQLTEMSICNFTLMWCTLEKAYLHWLIERLRRQKKRWKIDLSLTLNGASSLLSFIHLRHRFHPLLILGCIHLSLCDWLIKLECLRVTLIRIDVTIDKWKMTFNHHAVEFQFQFTCSIHSLMMILIEVIFIAILLLSQLERYSILMKTKTKIVQWLEMMTKGKATKMQFKWIFIGHFLVFFSV